MSLDASDAERENRFKTEFRKALKSGQRRNYRGAIKILENLAMEGFADGASGDHPEILLYLARSWHAEGRYARSALYARSYAKARPEDPAGWFFLGRSWLAEGNQERAFWALRKSLDLNPSSIDARLLLGSALLKARKASQARSVFEEALSRSPDDERLNQAYRNALFVEAVQLLKRGEADMARQMLTFLIDQGLDGVAPRLHLAHALRELGYLPEALSQYEAALEFAPGDRSLAWYRVALALELGDRERSSRYLAELGVDASEMGMSPEAAALTVIKNHLEAGEWSKAVAAARVQIKARGESPALHALMGEALRNLGNHAAALNHFRRALAFSKDNPGPEYGIIMSLVGKGDWASLLSELSRAERLGCDRSLLGYYRTLCRANLDEDPVQVLPLLQREVRERGAVPELLLALARTYFRLGMSDLALGWYEKVTLLEDANEIAWLGFLASAENGKDDEKTFAAYRGYLERWQDNLKVRLDFIRILSDRERWKDAADQAETVLSQDPQCLPLRQYALWRRKAGQYREAAILYRNMLRERPDDRILLSNLVFCLDRLGDRKNALALMREANRVLKCDASSLLIEARLLLRSGDHNGALEVLRKTIDRFPREKLAWEEMALVYEKQGVPEMAALHRQKARDLGHKKH